MSVNRNRYGWFTALSAVSMVPVWVGVVLLAGCAAPRAGAPSLPLAADTAEVVAYP